MDGFPDIRPVPPDVLLSWPAPNYVNPERRGPALLVVNCVFLLLTLAVVGIRLYTRLRIVGSAGLDDLFIALASFPAIALALILGLASIRYSWDVHIWDVRPQDVVPSRKASFTAQFLFLWASNFTRISILLFYKRISTTATKGALHSSILATIVIVVLYHISTTIALIASCSPPRAFWDNSIPHHCDNARAFEMAAAIINICLDFVIILLPISTIWSLRLPRTQKQAISGIFLLGGFVCAIGIARVYYVDVEVNRTFDITWQGFILWILAAIEVDLGIICASAPALKPLFQNYFTSIESTDFRYSRQFGDIDNGTHFLEPVNLRPLSTPKPDSQRQQHAAVITKVWIGENPTIPRSDNASEESIFVLQGVVAHGEALAFRGSQRYEVVRTTNRYPLAWKEPWSGI